MGKLTSWCDIHQEAYIEAYVCESCIRDEQERIEELERELGAIRGNWKRIMDEVCSPPDEIHCTCVPVLRTRIEELEADLTDRQNIAEAAVAMVQVAHEELKECKAENERLREALQRIADGRADEWFNWGEWARQALEVRDDNLSSCGATPPCLSDRVPMKHPRK